MAKKNPLAFLLFWQSNSPAQCDSTNDIIQLSGTSFYKMNIEEIVCLRIGFVLNSSMYESD